MLIPFEDFEKLFSGAGIEVTKPQYEKFKRYAELLVETNRVMNLTAITDAEGIAEKHFLDSVLPLKLFNIPDSARLADIGSGAGFPGVPLAIVRPDIKLTLIDSLLKRVKFLNMLTAELEIPAVSIHSRAEDAGRGELRGSFDIAVARAVSRLDKLAPWCLPLVKSGGVFLALKGGDCAEEISEGEKAVKKAGGVIEDVIRYSLPRGDGRSLVVIRKRKS